MIYLYVIQANTASLMSILLSIFLTLLYNYLTTFIPIKKTYPTFTGRIHPG